MKKTYALIILLLVFSIGSFGVIGSIIYEQRDQVTITENVLEGDKTAADGLTVVTRNQMGDHLFWDTTYQVGEEPQCETEYSFYQRKYDEVEDYVYGGINMYEYISYEPPSAWSGEEMTELQKEYDKLSNGLKAGETRTKTLYLKDYYEYYPIRMFIDLPNTVWTNEEPGTEVGDHPYDPKYVMNKFTDFFKIPVLESDYVTLHASKEGVSEDGHYVYTSHGSDDQSYFHLKTVCTYTEDVCYFSVGNRKQQEQTLNKDVTYVKKEYIDTSQISGGYGIYAFSYGRGDGEYHTGIDADSLQMVFPLEESALVKHMMIRDEKSQLVLITDENQDAYVTVIDLATMKQVQKFLLQEDIYDKEYYVEYIEEDDFIAMLTRGLVIVISEENGVYTHEFTVNEYDKLINDWNYLGRAMDFDGEKLAVIGNVYGRYGYVHQSCDFYLAVYDKSGLLYYGQYKNSLSVKTYENYNSQCMPNDVNTYAINW